MNDNRNRSFCSSQDPPTDSNPSVNDPSTSINASNRNQYTPDTTHRRQIESEGRFTEASLNQYEHLSPSFNDSNIRNDSLMMNTMDSRIDTSMSRNNGNLHSAYSRNNDSTLNLNNLSMMTGNSMSFPYLNSADMDTHKEYGGRGKVYKGTSVAFGIDPEEEEYIDEWMKMATTELSASIDTGDNEQKGDSLPELGRFMNTKSCSKKFQSQGEFWRWKKKERGRGGRGGSSSGSIGIFGKSSRKTNISPFSDGKDQGTSKSEENKHITAKEINEGFGASSNLMEKEIASRIMDNLHKLTDQLDEDKWFYESIEYVSDPIM